MIMQNAVAIVAPAVGVLRCAAGAFSRDRATRLAASLAYYSIFALVPSILTSLLIAAAFVGKEAARGGLADGLEDALGADAARTLEDALATTWETTNTSQFAVISIGVVVYSASVLFIAWRDIVEVIWDVPRQFDLQTTVRRRLYGIVAPVSAGFLLASLLVVEMVVGLLQQLTRSQLLDFTLRLAGFTISPAATVIALALLYRYSTRTRPPWRQVWPGAITAALGLAVAAWGFGLYLRFVASTSVAGAASSVFVGLVLLYYGSQILLFGAEVVKCCSTQPESDPDPSTASALSR